MAHHHHHSHSHIHHPNSHLHHDKPVATEFTYDEKSNRSMFITGAVLSSVGAVLFTLSILGFVEVILYDIAIPFLIVSVCSLALGLQFLISSLSDKKKVAKMIKCPDCGAYNNDEDIACYKCGKSFGTVKICLKCGAKLRREGAICVDCGYEPKKAEALKDKESL